MYRAPVDEIAFTLKHVAGLKPALDTGLFGDLSEDVVDAILAEAGRFATEEVAPLYKVGDQHGAVLKDAAVTTPPGWKELYRRWIDGGWNALSGPVEHGGQGLPVMLGTAALEMWNAGAMAFGIGPTLTMGAVEAIDKHASDALKSIYLPKLVSGEWMGTMNLTEPQAGSDLNALEVARRAGRRRHATASSAPRSSSPMASTISPTTSSIWCWRGCRTRRPARAACRCSWCRNSWSRPMAASASATTCSAAASSTSSASTARRPARMIYGDGFAKDRAPGAIGWLVGEENRGLACMFTMMNNARLAVGIQGVAVAEAATQKAIAFANERRQGKAASYSGEGMAPIVHHPDVKRDLLDHEGADRASRAPSATRSPMRSTWRMSSDGDAARHWQDRANLLDADRQGVRDRHRRRGELDRRAGAWRHGLHRGDRRGEPLSRRPHRADL